MPKGKFTRGVKRNWTAAELIIAEELIEQGLSERAIACRLGRSEIGVHVYLGRHGRSRRELRPMTARSVARLLGLGCAKTVAWWIESGWLVSRLGQRHGANRAHWISEEALLAFLEDPVHWHLWRPERITEVRWRDWACELRAGISYLTVGQVATRLGVDGRLVNKWIRLGRLPARRHANWQVLESDLLAFKPPRRLRRWTHEQVTLALNLRCQGLTFSQIGKRLGRNGETVGQRVRLALRHRPLWSAVWHVVQEFGGRAAILDVARVLDDRGIFPYDHTDPYGAVRDAAAGQSGHFTVRSGVIELQRRACRRRLPLVQLQEEAA